MIKIPDSYGIKLDEKTSKVLSLVYDRFPNYNPSNLSYDEATRINDYKEKLEKLSEDEFEKLYKELVKKKEAIRRKDEELRQEKINQREYEWFLDPKYNADFDYWLKADYWSVEECLALAFGKNPKEIYYNKVSLARCSELKSSPFVKKYFELFDLAERSIVVGSLKTMPNYTPTKTENKKVKPLDFVNWAKSKNISLPEKLLGVLQPKATLKEEHFLEILDKTSKNNQEMLEEITKLRDQLKNKTDELEKIKSEKVLGITEKRSLLKMIYGMAIVGYGWNPESSRSEKTAEIMRDVNQNFNKPITDDTVRKWLKEAKQMAEVLESED